MVGIIGAMDSEVEDLKSGMEELKVEQHASMSFYTGTLEGCRVAVVRSGIGKVNAAVAAEILAGIYHCESIINTGIAGSLDTAIDIGDIVLSTDTLQHDMDVTGLGYERGIIPDQETSVFTSDEGLRSIARSVCEEVNTDINVFEGRVLSGDRFISDQNVKDDLINTYHGMCCEMEGAAIAHVSWLNRIPFLIIRAISDKADNSAEVDYPSFQKKAIEHSVRLTKGILRRIR